MELRKFFPILLSLILAIALAAPLVSTDDIEACEGPDCPPPCPPGYEWRLFAGSSAANAKVFIRDELTSDWTESFVSGEQVMWSMEYYPENYNLYVGSYPNAKIYEYGDCEWSLSYDTPE